MRKPTIRDRTLIRLIDHDGVTQVEAARRLGVTKQAVNQRLKELRGKTTKAVVVRKIDQVVNRKLDAVAQLTEINRKAIKLLEEAEGNPELSLRCMSEIRGQLKLQLEIFAALYDFKAAAEFQEEVLAAIGEVAPDVRSKIIHQLNQKRAIRSAVRFY